MVLWRLSVRVVVDSLVRLNTLLIVPEYRITVKRYAPPPLLVLVDAWALHHNIAMI
jgi:hypothetical protein